MAPLTISMTVKPFRPDMKGLSLFLKDHNIIIGCL